MPGIKICNFRQLRWETVGPCWTEASGRRAAMLPRGIGCVRRREITGLVGGAGWPNGGKDGTCFKNMEMD